MVEGRQLGLVFMAACFTLASATSAQATKKLTRSLYPKQRQRVHRSFVPPSNGAKVRVAFFDADSTLRVTKSGAPCPNNARDQVMLPMTGPKIAKLVKKGYLVAVVSNQGGVEKGFIKEDSANKALRKACNLVSKQPGCAIHYYDYAPKYDQYRKPATGMADHLAKVVKQKYGREIDWERSIMVGDSGWKRKVDREPSGRRGQDFSNSDRCFAEAVRGKYGCTSKGMAFFHPRDFFGWAAKGVRSFNGLKDLGAFLQANPAKR